MTSPSRFQLERIDPPAHVRELLNPLNPMWWHCEDVRNLDIAFATQCTVKSYPALQEVQLEDKRYIVRAGDQWIVLGYARHEPCCLTYTDRGRMAIYSDTPPRIGDWRPGYLPEDTN